LKARHHLTFTTLCTALSTLCALGSTSAQAADAFRLGINSHATHAGNTAYFSSPQTFKNVLLGLGFNSYRDGYEWNWVQYDTGAWQVFPGGPGSGLNAMANVFADTDIRARMDRLLVLAYNHPARSSFDPTSATLAKRDLTVQATMDGLTTSFNTYVDFVLGHDVPVETGKTQWLEVWNEWNLGSRVCKPKLSYPTATSSPSEIEDWNQCAKNRSGTSYAAFLHKVSQHIKVDKGRTDIKLISQGMGDRPAWWAQHYPDQLDRTWLKEFIGAGGMNDVDGLGIHLYDWKVQNSERQFVLLNNAYAEVKTYQGYVERPWFITETGLPTNAGRTEQDQLLFLTRFTLLTRTLPFIRGLWLYDLGDDGIDDPAGTDEANIQHHFGLVTVAPNNQPKLAYKAMACLAGPVTDPTQANFTLVAGNNTVLQNGLYAVQYIDKVNKQRVTAMWSSAGTTLTVKVTSPNMGQSYAQADFRNSPCVGDAKTVGWFSATNAYSVAVGAQPVYLWQSLNVPKLPSLALSTN
jgi:hypothetical protein